MKISKILFALIGGAFIGNANAADITVFYSPTCPHCHHARDFIKSTLIYEYDNLKVSEIDVTNVDNRQAFVDALFKCGYTKGGVPVLVVGNKCFQGYASSTQNELRSAIEIDLSDAQKAAAAANKEALKQDKDAFVASHAERLNAITDGGAKKKVEQTQQ